MVCDSRVQTDSTWWPGTKVIRVGDALIGGAGDSATISKFVDWYGTRRTTKPKFGDNFVALVLDESGLHYWCSTLVPETVGRGFHAIGTGGNAALGAMMANANCRDAVHIACQIDPNSGGEIQSHNLKPNP